MKELTYAMLCNREYQNIYCFGAGKGFRELAVCLQKLNRWQSVTAVADNDETRWGKQILVCTRKIPVISPAVLRAKMEASPERACIVISCNFEEEIRAQLTSYVELAEIPAGFYLDIKRSWEVEQAERQIFSQGLRSTAEQRIPPVIHYCWFGGREIPAELQRYMESWHKMCPEYEIKRWDETNYDIEKHPYMQAAARAGKWGFVSDYARLDVLYEHGGIYLDTDVELVKNLDELRYNEAFMGMDLSARVSLGLGLGAVPHHPMLKELRDAYDHYTFVDFRTKKERREKHILIGPDLQTMEFEHYGFKRDYLKMQDVSGVRIYPIPVLCGLLGNREVITEYTYALHHYAGTWVPKT